MTTARPPDYLSEVEVALQQVQETTQITQHEDGNEELWADLDDLFRETESNIREFTEVQDNITQIQDTTYYIPSETTNPIEEFNYQNHLNTENDIVDFTDEVLNTIQNEFVYPTPPHSEDVASPMSDSLASMYRPISEYTLSPERSSPICNSDCEVFQEIAPIDSEQDYPAFFSSCKNAEKKRERNTSTGSIKKHMKQYKEMQKEIANGFSKKECCQTEKKPCKVVFQEYLQKLEKNERMNLCYKVSGLDMKTCYG